jgi:hypothetical protein
MNEWSMQHRWNDNAREILPYSERYLFQLHSVHYKSLLNDLELNLGLCGEWLVTVSAMAYPLCNLSGYENIFGYKT